MFKNNFYTAATVSVFILNTLVLTINVKYLSINVMTSKTGVETAMTMEINNLADETRIVTSNEAVYLLNPVIAPGEGVDSNYRRTTYRF